MSGDRQHPKLVAALAKAAAGDYGPVLAVALGARAAQDDGRYCECADPILTGLDLMCGACLLNNRDQEIRRVVQLVEAHDFVPLEGIPFMCEVCTMGEDAPRHHGVNEVGRTSWGTEVRPS